MVNRLLAAIFGAFSAAGSASAETLSDTQIIAAVNDLSSGDQRAVEIARSIVSGDPSIHSWYLDWLDDFPVLATIAARLDGAERLESLDWASEMEESAEAFARLFETGGLDPTGPLAQLATTTATERGDTVGLAYAAFRPVADAAGYRILGLNADSDMYHFVLAPVDAVERWMSVRIGENQYIEDSDWQFRALLEEAGLELRSTAHPSKNERPAPNVD